MNNLFDDTIIIESFMNRPIKRKPQYQIVDIDKDESIDADEKDSKVSSKKELYRYCKHYQALSHQGMVYSISFVIISQFMYINFDYNLGVVILILSVCSIITHLTFYMVESVYHEKGKLKQLALVMKIHKVFMLILICLYIPLLIWAIIEMFRQRPSIL